VDTFSKKKKIITRNLYLQKVFPVKINILTDETDNLTPAQKTFLKCNFDKFNISTYVLRHLYFI